MIDERLLKRTMVSLDAGGMPKRRTRCGLIVVRASEGIVTGLPVKAGDALVVDAVLLVVPFMIAGETECLFRSGVVNREMVKFLKESESFKVVEGVNKVSFLFIDDMI